MDELPKPEKPPQLCVGITYNLKKQSASGLSDDQAEYDDLATILALQSALEEAGCRVELLEATEELPLKLAERKTDIVFNIAEGTAGRGREAQVPSMLSLYRVPYTGSDETTLCLALDKALTKRLLASYHIRTPKYQVFRSAAQRLSRFSYPVIVKPNAEGSSKGISSLSVVGSARELRETLSRNIGLYKQDMLVEEYIDGREFTVGLIGNGGDIRVFPPMEIIYKDRESPFSIYSYEVKKNYQHYIHYECPANLDAEIRTEMESTAKKIYELLDCRDFARVDFRLSPSGLLYFIEINPLPGLAPGYSDYPMIAGFIGIDYPSLIREILAAALKRYGLDDRLESGKGHE